MFNKKIKYFKEKVVAVEKMIWDLEFKRAKTEMIREEIRQKYDETKQRLSIIEAKAKSEKEKPTIEKGEIARLDDQIVILKRDIERYEAQMKGLDLEVRGSVPTEEFKEGVQGINDQIDALQELKVMLKDYIKEL